MNKTRPTNSNSAQRSLTLAVIYASQVQPAVTRSSQITESTRQALRSDGMHDMCVPHALLPVVARVSADENLDARMSSGLRTVQLKFRQPGTFAFHGLV